MKVGPELNILFNELKVRRLKNFTQLRSYREIAFL